VKEVEKELRKQKEEITFISLSNSSDPYPPEERKLGITREVLNVLNNYDMPFHIVTKSDIVVRDHECIGKNGVSMTITEMDSKRMEPGAPATELRVKALKELSDHGIKCTLRLDPVIPCINSSYDSIYSIIHGVCDHVKHVTSSTLKTREDSLYRLEKVFPRIKWRALYTQRVGRSYYLQEQERLKLMQRVKDVCGEHGLTFSCCREGFDINTGKSCDGSHLLEGVCRGREVKR
jgi:DNA repair photolyase